MRKSSPLLIAALVGLSLTGCSDPYPANTSAQGQLTQATSAEASGIRLYTEPSFKGQASSELNVINDKIRDYIAVYPEVFSGGYFSSDSSRLMVGVAQPDHPAASDYEELANKLDPGRQRVLTKPAKWSWSALDKVKDILAAEYLVQTKGLIQSVGLNVALDTVVVTVRSEGFPLESNPAVLQIAKQYGEMVMFRKSTGEVTFSPGS
ncbi:hypothetical protein ACFVTE_16900 [Arthrobacter sp. NPDC058097]|uniref:hypothetical protein n=1 Tax=Arthrobacter sp. NPDC058097 TaxID=3346340 RepID=UPI0036DBE136